MTDNTAMVLMTLIFFSAPCILAWLANQRDKKDDEK